MTPRISVLVAAYNEAAHIAEALQSVFDQEIAGTEIIVVDDGSRDDTAAIVERLAARAPMSVRLVRDQANRGLAAARNTALAAARGEFAVLLDGDDRFGEGMLAHLLACLHTTPVGTLVFPRHQWIAADGSPLPLKSAPPDGPVALRDIVLANPIHSDSGAMARRTDLLAVGGFDERLTGYVGADFWIRYALTHGNKAIRAEPRVTVLYRRHDGQITANWRRMDRNWRILSDKLGCEHAVAFAPIRRRALARHRLFCAHIAYRAGEYGAARRFILQASLAEPKLLVTHAEARVRWLACLASLLPTAIHHSLRQNYEADRELQSEPCG
jgi:glycosyltransferase involved in cell wall biosynthesis